MPRARRSTARTASPATFPPSSPPTCTSTSERARAMSDDTPTLALEYLAIAARMLETLADTQRDAIAAAAELVAEAVRTGRSLHAFGSGHSHMLAEELYYRAGGLVDVRPILFERSEEHTSELQSRENLVC